MSSRKVISSARGFGQPFEIRQIGRVDLPQAGQEIGQTARLGGSLVDLLDGAILVHDGQEIVDDLAVGIEQQGVDFSQARFRDCQ